MVFCPKCGYERKPKDDDFISKDECPKCGVVYEKYAAIQRKAIETKVSAYEPKSTTKKHPYARNLMIWFFIVFTVSFITKFINNANKINTDVITPGISTQRQPLATADTRRAVPPEQRNTYAPYGVPDRVATNHIPSLPANDKSREISNAIKILSNTFDQTLTDSQVYHNIISTYGWETLKTSQNYRKIQSILHNYRIQHTYMGNDLFVCVDMAVDVWNLLTTAGIRAKLMVGNVETDIATGNTIKGYLSKMRHAWILTEVSPSLWIPLETTGGYIVEPSKSNFALYNKGTMFENPKAFKEFNTSRNAMFETCNETATMADNFNRQFAGKPVTTETTEYTGRMKQKLEDCEHLLGKVIRLSQLR